MISLYQQYGIHSFHVHHVMVINISIANLHFTRLRQPNSRYYVHPAIQLKLVLCFVKQVTAENTINNNKLNEVVLWECTIAYTVPKEFLIL